MRAIFNQMISLFVFTALLGSTGCDKKTSGVVVTEPVHGLITAVEERTILLQDDSGNSWSFQLPETLDVPVDHLKEHKDQKWPVNVYYTTEANQHTATKITD